MPKYRENIDMLLRRFKRLCDKDGIKKEYKKHQFFESRSEKRRRIKQRKKYNDKGLP
jgi:small subunit ribosomal protein S21